MNNFRYGKEKKDKIKRKTDLSAVAASVGLAVWLVEVQVVVGHEVHVLPTSIYTALQSIF